MGWYDHRPVLVTANDAATQLYNGDVGVTLAIDGVPMVHFPASDGGVRSFMPSQLPAHETAWAMTVHKSQGSEFDHVLVVLPEADSRVLTRELLYTAVTRARRSVTISGSDRMIEAAIHRSVVRGPVLRIDCWHRLARHSAARAYRAVSSGISMLQRRLPVTSHRPAVSARVRGSTSSVP